MPNSIRDEIKRLAKREANAIAKPIKTDTVSLKRAVSDIKKLVARIERTAAKHQNLLASLHQKSLDAKPEELENVRFRKDTVKSLRKRLGLTQGELARLAGVSTGSVLKWEKGGLPRKAQQGKLISLRSMGARRAKELLEGMRPAKPKPVQGKKKTPTKAKKKKDEAKK